MSDFNSADNNSPANSNDPIKRAFDERRQAAQHVGVETGLALVHRTNAPARRMAKAGGALLVAAAIIGGGFVSLGGSEDTVRTDLAEEIEQPDTTEPPPDSVAPVPVTVLPEGIEAEPSEMPEATGGNGAGLIVIADGSGTIVTLDPRDPTSKREIDTGLTGVRDAVDDGSGGVVLDADDGIYHKQPGQEMVQVVPLVEGNVVIVDVAVDSENAGTTLWYTEWTGEFKNTALLRKLQLDGPGFADLGVLGSKFGASGGAVGETNSAGNSNVYLTMDDGPCTWLLTVDGSTGAQTPGEQHCVDDGDEPGASADRIQSVVVDPDGQPLVFTFSMLGGPGTADAWGDWQAWVVPTTGVVAKDVRSGEEYQTGIDGWSVRVLTSPLEAFDNDVETPDVPNDGVAIDAIDLATYRVIDVAADDVLNIRAEPNAQAAKVGEAPNGAQLDGTGTGARLPSGANWVEVQVPGTETIGWVNARFLEVVEPNDQGDGDSFAELGCLVQESGSTIAAILGAPSPADHVAGLRSTSDGSCERIIVDLGQNFSFESPGQPVSEVPGGLTLGRSDDGRTIVLDLGTTIDMANFEQLRAGAAVVTNSSSGGLHVEILSGPANFATTALSNPARIVIDYIPTSPSPDQLPVPFAEDAGVIVRSIDGLSVRGGVNVINGTATVRGFARPFEAQLGLSMLDANGDLFEGVTWNGGFQDDVTASQYSTRADWQVMGSFEFSFDAPPGEYTLRFSNDSSAADVPTFLEIPITVAQ